MAEKAKAVQPHATLTDALIAAQAGFDAVRKQATNPHFKSKYADLSTVVDAVLPHLNANGILLTQPVLSTPDGLMLRTLLRHTSGQELACEVPLPTPANWQQWGSALTYCRRYSIMALLGVAPEDDDGNDAAGVPPHAPSSRAKQNVAEPVGAARSPKPTPAGSTPASCATAAPSPSAPPASAPVATTATGRNEFLDDLDREMDRALAKDVPNREWTPESVKERGAEIASSLRDHGQQMMNLVAVWQQHADEIMTMPAGAQKGLRKVYNEEFSELERNAS